MNFFWLFQFKNKSEPSAIRLYQYPNVEAPIANKSFFNADKVDFKWNKSGKFTSILILFKFYSKKFILFSRKKLTFTL